MTDYTKGKIYKIQPLNVEEVGDIYIGSTTKNTLAERMTAHRADYKKWLVGKTNYTSSYFLFEKYGINNCMIYLLETFPCKTKDELRTQEGYYIQNIKCINKNMPIMPTKNKKEYLFEQHKIYRTVNEKRIKALKNMHFDCFCGGSYTNSHRSRHMISSLHTNHTKSIEQILKEGKQLLQIVDALLLDDIKNIKPIKIK